MSLMEVIKFSPVVTDWIIFKSPATEFNHKSKLFVGPGQTAICVYNGKVIGEFEAGSFDLDSANLPFIKEITKKVFGGVSPYQMEVYFINKTIKLDFWWGITNGIQLTDPKYNVIVVVQARGQMGLRLVNKQFFLTQLVGSFGTNLVSYTKVQEFFRSTINTKIKPLIISYITKNKISTLDLAMAYEDIANDCKVKLEDDFEMFGFELISLGIETLEPRSEDLVKLNDILHRRAEFDIIGSDNYKTVRSFDVLETAAGNEGGGTINAGMGLGVGFGAGQVAGQMFGQMTHDTKENKVVTKVICPECKTHADESAKFCSECGYKFSKQCTKCHAPIKPGMKFCMECGEKV